MVNCKMSGSKKSLGCQFSVYDFVMEHQAADKVILDLLNISKMNDLEEAQIAVRAIAGVLIKWQYDEMKKRVVSGQTTTHQLLTRYVETSKGFRRQKFKTKG